MTPFGVSTPVLFLLAFVFQSSLGFIAKYDTLRINCGGNKTVEDGIVWSQDSFFENGITRNTIFFNASAISSAASLRAFDSFSCYSVPVVDGRYLVRLGFTYGNFDGFNDPPTFIVQINDVVVADTSLNLYEVYNQSTAFSEFFVYSYANETMKICLSPIKNRAFVNTIEVVAIDTEAYLSLSGFIASTLLRVNVGGPAITKEPYDRFSRRWEKDSLYVFGNTSKINTTAVINGSDSFPDYIPDKVLSTGRRGKDQFGITFVSEFHPLSPFNAWLVRMHFAEFNRSVKNGSREFLFQVSNGPIIKGLVLDVFEQAGEAANTALKADIFIQHSGFQWATAIFSLVPFNDSLPPILNGIEVLEYIPLSSRLRNYRSPRESRSPKVAAVIIVSTTVVILVAIAACCFVIWYRRRVTNAPASNALSITPASAAPPTATALDTQTKSSSFSNWFSTSTGTNYVRSDHGHFDDDIERSSGR